MPGTLSDRHERERRPFGRLLTSSLRSFGTTYITLGKMHPVVTIDQRDDRSSAVQLSGPSSSGLVPCQVTSRWVLALVAAT